MAKTIASGVGLTNKRLQAQGLISLGATLVGRAPLRSTPKVVTLEQWIAGISGKVLALERKTADIAEPPAPRTAEEELADLRTQLDELRAAAQAGQFKSIEHIQHDAGRRSNQPRRRRPR